MCTANLPPLLQGLSCGLAGLWGSGNGTTAYNENIGAMQITGVGSRRVVQAGAGICMLLALTGELQLAGWLGQRGRQPGCCSAVTAVHGAGQLDAAAAPLQGSSDCAATGPAATLL
jgi:hypothetical protein